MSTAFLSAFRDLQPNCLAPVVLPDVPQDTGAASTGLDGLM
jgi:hypothetical protein